MAKISPVSIKYMIHASLYAEGSLEKPDVIGALFGQTEGLLGADLEMRELQKEGKIGRIEVSLEKQDKRTIGKITIPTALDQSETTLIAAAIETIERAGPCDAQIEIEKIEDVRGSKREYILERAKKLMKQIEGSSDSREISNEIKDSKKISGIKSYGDSNLASGDLSGDEIIVVEGRADVINLVRAGINNVIGMNGTKLPDEIKELGKDKEITLFIDGDRGGRLIAQNVVENAKIKYIAVAPDGKEVEELTSKEILMNLRRKIPVEEFFKNTSYKGNSRGESSKKGNPKQEKLSIGPEEKQKLKEISKKNEGSSKAILLDSELNEIKELSVKSVAYSLNRINIPVAAIVIDGTVTGSIIKASEEIGVQVIVASNFKTTDTNIQLLSL